MKRQHRPHVDEEVFLLLGKTHFLCKKLGEKNLRPFGITLSEYTVLRIIENTPQITAVEIRKRLSTTAPSVAQLVKNLSQKDMIGRKLDSHDVRRRQIILTEKGRETVHASRKSIQATLQKLKIRDGVLFSLLTNLMILSSSLSPYDA